MDSQRDTGPRARFGRREVLRGLSSAGVAGLLGAPRRGHAEPLPETTKLRLIRGTSMCWAPQYVAEELLRTEGFSDITYVDQGIATPGVSTMLAAGDADISMNFVGPNLIRVDQGDPVVFLAGAHVGCFEVFGGERFKRITELKGKTVSVTALGSTEYVFFSAIGAYVGLDPRKDINWVIHEADEAVKLFVDGKV